jgi:putative DNA primase/helicase
VADDAEIARLAALPQLQYERQRESAAEKLGCRVSILDSLVATAPDESTGDSGGLGQPLLLDDIKPWPEPVDGPQLLDEITAEIRRYVVLSAAGVYAVALWVVANHAFNGFSSSRDYSSSLLKKGAERRRCSM